MHTAWQFIADPLAAAAAAADWTLRAACRVAHRRRRITRPGHNDPMRGHGRPRNRAERLRLTADGQLTFPVVLEAVPDPPTSPRPWDATFRRTLAYRRCAHPTDGWRCRTRAAHNQDRCLLHND